MVALKGRGWVLAPSLKALVDQVDYIAGGRNKDSDGSIGDQRHKVKNSDHNPADGYVTAVDVTHDPDGGFDSYAFAESLRVRRDPRVKYVISNGRIFSSYKSGARDPWEWGKYSGVNAHKNHVHVSVLSNDEGLTSDSLWFEGGGEPVPSGGGDKRTLQIGMRGDDVAELQFVLNTAGILPGRKVDGIFGPNTQAGVKEWQRRLGVSVDGVFGPESQAATDKFFAYIGGL